MSLPELTLSTSNVTTMHFTLHVDPERGDHVSGDPFDLEAPYQRPSVWTVEQRQNLVRSLLMRLPIGAVTVSQVYRVVDGKQRVETLRAFVLDELAVPADWWHPLDVDADHYGLVSYSGLSDRGRRHFGNCSVGLITFDPSREWVRDDAGKPVGRNRSDDEMLRAEAELYLLLNFGGVDQTNDDRARAEAIIR